MRCSNAPRFTKFFISFFLGLSPSSLDLLAQTISAADLNSSTGKPVTIWSVPDSRPTFLKNLTIESFGFTLAPQAPGFQFSPGYTATFFNLQGLECPACKVNPLDRSRFTLPPFGAKATWKLHEDRVQLFGGFAALEAWKPDGTFEPRGHSAFSSSYGDAWLTQVEAGGRISLDPGQHLWLGASGRHMYNFGPGMKEWNSVSGSATFEFGRR